MVLSQKWCRTGLRGTFLGRISGVLLVLGLLLSTASAKYGGGSGTADDPWLIYTAEQFQTLGESPSDWHERFKLMADIDLSGYTESNFNMVGKWVALGSVENVPFSGVFDGNGRTIRNFRYMDIQAGYVGLFQYVAGSIRNLHLRNATVVGNQSGAGALVGYLEGVVRSSSATGVDVTGNVAVGGLVGRVDGSVYLSWSDGTVTGARWVGGLVGKVDDANLDECYSKAKVIGGETVGGLVGYMTGNHAVVKSCHARGDVRGDSFVGGLVGSVSRGAVSRCYSVGAVSGDRNTGGLVGSASSVPGLHVTRCMWDVEASGQAESPAGDGHTTAEMKSFATYEEAGWDFGLTWGLCEGVNYPVLLWQIPPADLRCPDGVTFIDFAVFAQQWMRTPCIAVNDNCDWADLNESGAVDYEDLAVLAADWLGGLP